MMHSDFYALAACAISVLYIPFLVIAQLRFSHILQCNGYSTAQYFQNLKQHIAILFVPLIGICVITALGRLAMWAYLNYSELYELDYFAGYFVVLMILAAVIAIVYTKYCNTIKIESGEQPLVCSGRWVNVCFLSCMLVCVLLLLVNLVMQLRVLVFFMPLFTPFFVPAANGMLGGGQSEARGN